MRLVCRETCLTVGERDSRAIPASREDTRRGGPLLQENDSFESRTDANVIPTKFCPT